MFLVPKNRPIGQKSAAIPEGMARVFLHRSGRIWWGGASRLPQPSQTRGRAPGPHDSDSQALVFAALRSISVNHPEHETLLSPEIQAQESARPRTP